MDGLAGIAESITQSIVNAIFPSQEQIENAFNIRDLFYEKYPFIEQISSLFTLLLTSNYTENPIDTNNYNSNMINNYMTAELYSSEYYYGQNQVSPRAFSISVNGVRYPIIDLTLFDRFKPLIHIMIISFSWYLFLRKLYKSLPGFIGGFYK